MKAYNFMLAAAIVMLAACTEDPYAGMGTKPVTGDKPSTGTTPEPDDPATPENPPVVEKTVTFTAVAEGEDPAPKAVIGTDGSKPQTFWEPGDEIMVWSDADQTTGYTFSTAITSNSATADFTYTGAFQEGTRYIAVHPAKGSTCTFDDSSITGAVVIPSNQTLEEGKLNKDYLAALAYSAGGNTLAFKNATALVKFQVGDARVYSGSISTSEGKQIAGTYKATFDSDGIPTLTTTNTERETVNFKVADATALSVDKDYYVAVAPVANLTGGFTLTYKNGKGTSYIAKTYDVDSFQRNTIYNVGDGSSNENVSKMVVHFHFDDTDAYASSETAWPTSAPTMGADEIRNCTFTLNGQDFTFQLAAALDGSKKGPYVYNNPNSILLSASNSFLGLPAIPDFKLVKVSVMNKKNSSSTQNACICEDRQNAEDTKKTPTGGDYKLPVYNKYTDWELTGTEAGKVYWLYQSGSVSLIANHIELTYEKVETENEN